YEGDAEHQDRRGARAGQPRRVAQPGAEHLHPQGRAEEDVRLRQGRALEHGDQDLSERWPVLEVRQGGVPAAAGLRARFPAVQELRIGGCEAIGDWRGEQQTQESGPRPGLGVAGLSKSFGGLHAVRGVDLKIMPGDRKAIIGPNGAGKTTLFNLITGILRPSGGQVLLFGRDVTTWPSHSRAALGMARTFQITSLFPRLTVLDNVLLAINGVRPSKFVAWRFMSSYRDVYEKADRLLEQAAFLDRRDTEVRHLSHGEQRQLEIVLGLASDPKILLLDEPAA